MTDADRPTLWHAWLQPAALLVVLGVLGSSYAAVLLQRERIQRLEARIAVIETQYQRQDVVRAQLDAIIQRLGAIERAVQERAK